MAEEQDIKSTEFDSSVATLKRVDALIFFLHDIKLNPAQDGVDSNWLYVDTLDRIYMEVVAKMDSEEELKAEDFRKLMGTITQKWRKDICMKYKKVYDKTTSNQQYRKAWAEMGGVVRNYEIFLMKTMDRHNMLLKDKTMGIKKFRGK